MSARLFVVVSLLLCTACGASSPTAPSAPVSTGLAGLTLVASSSAVPEGGGTVTITVVTMNTPTSGVAPNVDVTLEATDGTLSATQLRTNADGRGQVTWTGTRSATVIARANGLEARQGIAVATPAPKPRLNVQLLATPTVATTVAPVHFSATVSTEDGSPVGPVSFAWDVDRDGRVDGTGSDLDFTFSRAGDYDALLTVRTPDGREQTARTPVFVNNGPPPSISISALATPSLPAPGDQVQLFVFATPSTAAGSIVRFEWDFDSAQASVDRVTTERQTVVTYPSAGDFTVTVTAVTDTGFRASATTLVRVVLP